MVLLDGMEFGWILDDDGAAFYVLSYQRYFALSVAAGGGGIDTEEMDELLVELHLVASFMREVRTNTKQNKYSYDLLAVVVTHTCSSQQ